MLFNVEFKEIAGKRRVWKTLVRAHDCIGAYERAAVTVFGRKTVFVDGLGVQQGVYGQVFYNDSPITEKFRIKVTKYKKETTE